MLDGLQIACQAAFTDAKDRLFCLVPGRHKADAVRLMWDGPITDKLPASLLRLHPAVALYLDAKAASLLATKPEAES